MAVGHDNGGAKTSHPGPRIVATKATLLGDLDYLSTTVGERSRVIAFALIATWWAALIGKDSVPGLTAHALIGPVLFASAAIFCDFAQYAFSYLFAAHQLAVLERSGAEEYAYDKTALPYRIRLALFYLKQLCMLAGLGWFIVILWPFVFAK